MATTASVSSLSMESSTSTYHLQNGDYFKMHSFCNETKNEAKQVTENGQYSKEGLDFAA